MLQTDVQSLSSILPSLLDLHCHLQQFPSTRALASSMLKDTQSRMKSILDPECDTFNPLPASATLLDPTLAKLLLVPEMEVLLRAAKRYIIGECRCESEASTSVSADAGVQANPPAFKRFKYLATKLSAMAPDQESASGISNCTDTVQGQLNRYIAEFEQSTVDDALGFWAARRSYKLLAPLAEGLLAAPASQAFVERIFSVCGLRTTGRRNRMCKSLEMRAFLKLNRNVC